MPNILRVIEQLRQLGIEQISLLAGKGEQSLCHLLREEKALEIVGVAPEKLGEAIVAAAAGDDALVYYGDVCASIEDVAQLLEAFGSGENAALLTAFDETIHPQDAIGAMEIDGSISRFIGHPRPHYANARVGGIFALRREVVAYAAVAAGTFLEVPVGGMPPLGYFFEQCLQTAMEDGHVVKGVYTRHPYTDMDFPWDILAANIGHCRSRVAAISSNHLAPGATISDKATIKGFVHLGKNSHIGDRVVIQGNCVVGDNTVIDNGAIIGKNCVIGDSCMVQDYCKISDESVIGHRNKIGFSAEIAGVTFENVAMVHGCEIFGVVGRNTDIAAGCAMAIMRFDDMENPNKVGGKRYSGNHTNGVFLGDFLRTGIGNLFAPGVKVGCNSALGPGLIVNKDVPNNTLVMPKQEVQETTWGPERYGW